MPDTSATMPTALYAVTLGTNDVAGQRRFYESWGWEALPYSNEGYVAFKLQDVILAFFPLEKAAEEAAPGTAVPPIDVWNRITLAFNVGSRDEVDSTWKACVAAGATSIAEPVDRVWGGRSGYVADPEGNRWEIAWVPSGA